MTRMTGPDCVVMCNLINTHTHTHILLYNSIYSTRFYVVMSHQFLYFRQNLLIPLLLFNKERSGEVR